MSMDGLLVKPVVDAASRTTIDPRAKPIKAMIRPPVRVTGEMLAECKMDARRLGLSLAEWFRVAAYAWLHRDEVTSGTITAQIEEAIRIPQPAEIVARYAKPHAHPRVDPTARASAISANRTGQKPRFRGGK